MNETRNRQKRRVYCKLAAINILSAIREEAGMSRALLLIDPQCDFITGSLPVPGAQAAMDGLAEWLAANPGLYKLKIATCDFHPWDHCSFTENGGQWPRHCVSHSQGAAIWPALMEPLHGNGQLRLLCKGCDKDNEQYSIFQDASGRLALASLLDGVDGVDICGIAGDVCVLNTLMDGKAIYGAPFFRVLKDFSPSLDGGAKLAAYCAEEGICAR